MSRSTSSFSNTSQEISLSMSRYNKAQSVGASELGRLSIANDSDDEMVETRSQARKGESSRSKDKGKGKATAGSSSKARGDKRKSSSSASKGARKRPSDDDDDEDDSSDDEEEAPAPTRRDQFRMMVSVLNLDHLSPVEFANPATKMSLQSQTLRVYADNMADYLASPGREAVWAQNLPSGAAWGDMAYKILERRKASAEHRFVSGDDDSIETLKRFDSIYFSIREMLVRPLYKSTHVDAKRNFVYLLADTLNFIIRECRPRGGENAIVYAGSAQSQERNIYMRFITKPEVQTRYMHTLMSLAQKTEIRDMFRMTRVRESLMDSCARIHRYIAVTPPTTPVFGPLGNFSQILDHFLQQLSIPLPR